MKKHMTGARIWLTGSRKSIERTVYTDGMTYFVKWYGEYIEVENHSTLATMGWMTVEAY